MRFEEMNLIAPILKATQEAGYEEPTPIQRETIPFVLEGKDVLGCAQTGTGKTAAFALPILQRLNAEQIAGGRKIRTLILTPTRELAIQIQENFQLYGKHLPLRSCVIFGGVNQASQVAQLKRGIDVLIATPGRLNDLIGQGYISLSNIEIFVLDEADRMLDMGFIHDVKRVIAQLPAKRQTLFFSATMPDEVEKLAMSILHEPESVKVDPVSSTVDTIRQTLYLVDKNNKKLLLAELLKQPDVVNALVFTRTKHGADKLVRDLDKAGIRSMAIHGNKSQNARQEALGQFKSGKLSVLIATDIAARGIDVAGLSHVFNFDLPNEPEAYVHRIGRTGRAGLGGDAISFCCIDEMKDLYAIEKLIGRKIPRTESKWPMEVFTETVKQPRQPRPERVAKVNNRGEAIVERRQSDRPRRSEAGERTNRASGSTRAQSGEARKRTAQGTPVSRAAKSAEQTDRRTSDRRQPERARRSDSAAERKPQTERPRRSESAQTARRPEAAPQADRFHRAESQRISAEYSRTQTPPRGNEYTARGSARSTATPLDRSVLTDRSARSSAQRTYAHASSAESHAERPQQAQRSDDRRPRRKYASR